MNGTTTKQVKDLREGDTISLDPWSSRGQWSVVSILRPAKDSVKRDMLLELKQNDIEDVFKFDENQKIFVVNPD